MRPPLLHVSAVLALVAALIQIDNTPCTVYRYVSVIGCQINPSNWN